MDDNEDNENVVDEKPEKSVEGENITENECDTSNDYKNNAETEDKNVNNDLTEKADNSDLIELDERLSAEDLISYHQKKKTQNESLPGVGVFSRKTLNWTGAPWEQAEIERRIENWSKPLSHSRVETRSSMNHGEWRPDIGKVKLSRWSGKMFEFMGTAMLTSLELWPEEALYLMEGSQLDLKYGELSMSLQQAYTALLTGQQALARYLVYAKLVKLGYRVLRHQGDLGITSYEREIGIDKYDKIKRKVKPLKGTQIVLNKNNGDSKDERHNVEKVIEKDEVEKSKANKICDIETSDSSDNINDASNNVTIAQLDGASDCDINEATPAKKRKLNSNEETKGENIEAGKVEKSLESVEKVSESDEKSVESPEKLSENLERSTESTGNSSVIIENPALTTKNASNDCSDDVVMLSSDEEYEKPSSPEYKVLEEEIVPDVVDLSSDEEPTPCQTTGIQYPISNISMSQTASSNSHDGGLNQANIIESAVCQVSTSVIRQIDKNIQLLQQNLPTGFVNPGEFLCSICKVKCNSEDTYKVHLDGKKHKQRLRELPCADLYCNICHVQSNSLIEFRVHVSGKRHIKSLKNMATNSQQELSDAEHGIIQIEYDAKPVKTKDGISFVKSKLTEQTSKLAPEPVPNPKDIRIIASKSSLLNNIPNCYGKPLTEVKVMDQFVPTRCKPYKSMYAIVSYKNQDAEIPQDYLDIEKERAEKEKYKYNCRVCEIPVPDEESLIKHIRSRQHAMKLNKPELTLVKDVDEIVIDEGCDNERATAGDNACRGFYPKHEEEIFFSKGNAQKVYNFGYYIPLKKHTKAQKRRENRQRRGGAANSFNSQQRNTQSLTAEEGTEENIRHQIIQNYHMQKEKIFQLFSEHSNLEEKDTEKEIVQDVIDLSSDDDQDIIVESEKEKVGKSDINEKNNYVEKGNEGAKKKKMEDKNNISKDSIEDILIDEDSSSRHSSSRYDSSFYSDDDSSNFDDVESHPELRLLKKSALGSLWSYEGKVGPLICPEMAENMDMIFKRIQGAPDPRRKFRKSKSKDLEIAFDIYKSSSNYKKSINMAPDYRVVLVDPRDPVPDNSQLAKLEQLYLDIVPVLFAIVDRGTVSFITMGSLTLPTFYDDRN